MSSFAAALRSGRFLVTAELNPPKGTDLTDMLRKAESLRGWVDAFNLTDSASAVMTMSPLGAAYRLVEKGFEPILQITSRDRNRIAVQGDLLAAANLGIHNLVCMGGDPPGAGDHPEAKPVFDLDTIALIKAVGSLSAGTDMMGKKLNAAADLFAGAVCNPGAPDLDKEMARFEEKIEAGAHFFQTQAVYDLGGFEKFMERAGKFNVPIIAGFIILKSGDMARRLNATLPGVSVPESLIAEMDAAEDRSAKSIEIGGRIVKGLKGACQGVHMMAIGWESRIPPMLEAAGIERRN
ncbi:MAG TPA: methylenetetrahydrofolate reductase [Dehalococcoidia bacterium]|nr:methylenetetrahydrofolate reductase [Dehalococcoidia bacterium]